MLDDASRYILAIEARHTERERDMLEVCVPALHCHGVPDVLYLDNGSTYKGNALRVACERLGITLIHAKPYDPQARGKMERFWATLRSGCLDYLSDCMTLHEVNARLLAFVETHYHRAPHAGLMGKSPGQVWHDALRGPAVDHLDEEQLERAFTVHQRRRVRKDSTLRLDGAIWETDAGFLAGRTVTVAHCLIGKNKTPWLEYEQQRYPLNLVDPVANSRRKRTAIPVEKSSNPPAFDPAGTLLEQTIGRKPSRKENS